MTKKPLGVTLTQLKLQYRMQMYISGTIDKVSFRKYSADLQMKFRKVLDTVEHEMATVWHTYAGDYETAMSAAPYYDAFMYLLIQISRASVTFPDKSTIINSHWHATTNGHNH